MASQITATVPALNFPKEVDYPTQEDWAAFSAAAELNYGILSGTWSDEMALFSSEANQLAIEVENNALSAQGAGNYQGDWTSKGYNLGESVTVSGVFYVCKLTHATGQNPTAGGSLYWVINNRENQKGTNIASATTTTIGTAGLGNYIHITGTTTITSFGTAANAGLRRTLIFDGIVTITNGANLICVGGTNIVTVANTIVSVIAETTTQWRVEYVIHPSVSFAELGYLDGVTSAIQTQINSKFTTASATESAQGIIELATSAEAQAGTSDTTAITPLKLRNAFNASGTAPIYASRAWVNFNGTGTVAIRASGNVSSITDNGVGDYTVNFTTAMPDANYSMSGGTQAVISGGSAELISFKDGVVPLAGSARIITHRTGAGNIDTTYATVTFFR